MDMLVLSLLFLLGSNVGALNFPGLDSCPKVQTKTTACNKENVQSITTEYYKVSPYGKCIRHYSQETVPCGVLKGTKKACPKIRFISHGHCIGGFRKNLIIRYTWDTHDQICQRKTVFIPEMCGHGYEKYQSIEKKTTKKGTTCKLPQWFEKDCEKGIRPVYMIYYKMVKGKCSRGVKYMSEPCGVMDKTKHCSNGMMIEEGPCNEEGFHYVLKKDYLIDAQNNCRPVNRLHYLRCSEKSSCPRDKIIHKFPNCVRGEQKMLVMVFERVHAYRCKSHYQMRLAPCGKSLKGHCPAQRFVMKGPCDAKGHALFLVTHYEVNKQNVCQRQETMFREPCEDKKAFHSSKYCPHAQYFQQPCVDNFRFVIRRYYARYNGKCKVRRELEKEPCSKTLKDFHCPSGTSRELSACVNGSMKVTLTSYVLDARGCHKKVQHVYHAC